MAFVSVIIPCYNSEKFVGRAVESVLRQTLPGYEIILVDNASTDNTLNILTEYANTHPGKIKVFQELRKGAPAARNKGLEQASGEWLQFLDSDDELLPNKLKHQVEVAKRQLVDLVVGSCYKLKEGEDESARWVVRAITNNPWKALIKSRLGKTSSLLWRKEAVVAAGGWNESMTSSQEYDLLFRMLKNGAKIDYTEMPDTVLHIRKNSIARNESNAKLIEILENRVNLRLAIRDYLAARGELTKELKTTIHSYIRSKLLPHKNKVPNYVDFRLNELGLQVSAQYFLRQKIRRFKKTTTAYLKSWLSFKPSKSL